MHVERLWRLRRSRGLLLGLALAGATSALALPGSAFAQTNGLFGDPPTQSVAANESATLRIRLGLPGQTLSVAEFDLIVATPDGSDCAAGGLQVDLTPGGPTWTGSQLANEISPVRFRVAMFMDAHDTNAEHDTMAPLTVSGGRGVVTVTAANATASRDLDEPPFFEVVDILPDDPRLVAEVRFADPVIGDNDGIPPGLDVCPNVDDPDQEDRDGDGIGDACNA